VADVDGGGLAFTRRRHPALQQHLDPVGALRITRPPRDLLAASGALWRAHVDAADDWIAADRYLGAPERLESRLRHPRGIVCRGPLFLLRRYARVLTQQGASASVSAPSGGLLRARSPLGLLHFGSSFIVGSSFEAERAG
jgi:hypothetical protein